MGRLIQFQQKLKRVTIESQERDLLKIVGTHEAAAVDLNIDQMMKGQTAIGDRIKPEYTPFTVQIKEAKGQISDHVTLKDEGDFHRGLFLNTNQWPAIFDGKDSKTGMLTEKYENVLGLTKPSKKEFAEEIRPDVIKYYGGILSV